MGRSRCNRSCYCNSTGVHDECQAVRAEVWGTRVSACFWPADGGLMDSQGRRGALMLMTCGLSRGKYGWLNIFKFQ